MNLEPMIATVLAGILVGLQGYTLKELVGVKVKLASLETVLRRLPCEEKRPGACPTQETEEP
jgi:hypothetical protein